jgi:hypothetical protein
VGIQPFEWGGDLYFNGGYNTFRHGSLKNHGKSNATQIETPILTRKTNQSIQSFAEAFSKMTLEFFVEHYGLDLSSVDPKSCKIVN